MIYPRHVSRGAILLWGVLAVLILGTGRASAETVHPFLGYFNGSDSIGSGPFHGFQEEGPHGEIFSTIGSVAVNATNGHVYVYDSEYGGVIEQFDEGGHALPFTDPSLGGNSSLPVGPGNALAIDGSSTSSAGNIYFGRSSEGEHSVLGFSPSGAPLGSNFPLHGLSGDCGLAVGPDGNIWITEASGIIAEYTSAGVPTGTTIDTSSTGLSPCALATDAQGNVFVEMAGINGFARLDEYSPTDQYGFATTIGGGGAVAVDPANSHVFLAGNGGIDEYDASGHLLGRSGLEGVDGESVLGCVSGIAVTASDLLFSGDFCRGRVNRFGPSVIVPDVTTERATDLGHTFATLRGSFDPVGGPNATECHFDWGETTEYGHTAPCVPAAPYSGPTSVEAKIEGLTTESTYHYRIVVSNENGVDVGVDQTVTPHNVLALSTDPVTDIALHSATLNASYNGDGTDTHYYFQYGPSEAYGFFTAFPPGIDNGTVAGPVHLSAPVSELTAGTVYHYRVVASNALGVSFGQDQTFVPSAAPRVEPFVTNVNTDGALLKASINPGSLPTTYRFEWGETPAYGHVVPLHEGSLAAGAVDQVVQTVLEGLAPGVTYHFRVVAKNADGETDGGDRSFVTFSNPAPGEDRCPNALSRQQTGAAALLDCRSYELVSARNTGGYDVESDLVPGQMPFAGFPNAKDRVLYSVHSGVIPGVSGDPTNKGSDPYLAVRGEDGWTTEYVGMPATNPFSLLPFSSDPTGVGEGLETFAFGATNGCSPCFEDGTTGIPVRMPDGSIVQGMVGSLNPGASARTDGAVRVPLSADGRHLIFSSSSKFESDANSNGDVSIYDRDLVARTTSVVSKNPAGGNLTCIQGPGTCHAPGDTDGISELDVSADGSHVLIGQKVRTDSSGRPYWHLYMNVDDSSTTIDVTPGATDGVLFDGMASDGSRVYFSTDDQLAAGDHDASEDLYMAVLGASTAALTRISTGSGGVGDSDACDPVANIVGAHWNSPGATPTCDAVAIAGGGGLASAGGAIYLLSPERLDGAAGSVADQPNLYVSVDGGSPRYVATLDPNDAVVRDSVEAPETADRADFQVSADGRFAVFQSTASLTGFDNAGHAELFRYLTTDSGQLDCVSCNPTNARASGSAELARDGLSIADDGSVFFTTTEPLVLRDTNGNRDVYEWENGVIELISKGTSPFDSSLLSISADGIDAFFFTHDLLEKGDENGELAKIYDARVDGGRFAVPPPPPCAASDECHGPGTQPAPPPTINSVQGIGGNYHAEHKKHHRHRHKHHRSHPRAPRGKSHHHERGARR